MPQLCDPGTVIATDCMCNPSRFPTEACSPPASTNRMKTIKFSAGFSARQLVRALIGTAGVLALAGCGVASLQPGMSEQEVFSRLGSPTRVVALPSGKRLQYSYQPFGQEAVMVDLDSSGHVVRARQVLNEADFGRISTSGDWTRDDVEREFGPPSSVGQVASWDGPILAYRWRGGMVDQLYWVYLDRAGVVRRAHAGMDPRQFRDPR
jgi:hypothetical protein